MRLRFVPLALSALFLLSVSGCGKEQDVPYGGEVKTAVGPDGKAAAPSGKPMGVNQPSVND
jgi:hypothetical protein